MTESKTLKTQNKYEGCPEELTRELKAGNSVYGKAGDTDKANWVEGQLIDYSSWSEYPYHIYTSSGNTQIYREFHPSFVGEEDNPMNPQEITLPVTFRHISTFNPGDYTDIEAQEFLVRTEANAQYLVVWDSYHEELCRADEDNDVDLTKIITHYTALPAPGALQTIFSAPDKRDIIDWENMPIDTPFLVSGDDENDKVLRYYARVEEGKPKFWLGGKTSETCTLAGTWDHYQQIVIPRRLKI